MIMLGIILALAVVYPLGVAAFAVECATAHEGEPWGPEDWLFVLVWPLLMLPVSRRSWIALLVNPAALKPKPR